MKSRIATLLLPGVIKGAVGSGGIGLVMVIIAVLMLGSGWAGYKLSNTVHEAQQGVILQAQEQGRIRLDQVNRERRDATRESENRIVGELGERLEQIERDNDRFVQQIEAVPEAMADAGMCVISDDAARVLQSAIQAANANRVRSSPGVPDVESAEADALPGASVVVQPIRVSQTELNKKLIETVRKYAILVTRYEKLVEFIKSEVNTQNQEQ